LGVANASNYNMDKDGDQIIHEECMIRDHEQKEGKLPSKLSRRLPTTHDDYFMAGHQHQSLNGNGFETRRDLNSHD